MNHRHTVSIVIPTFNERENVKPLVRRIHEALTKRNLLYELIFIDDHSTDGTSAEILKLAQEYPLVFEEKQGKRGKAYSLIQGFRHVRHEIVAMIDADLQYPPEAIPDMVRQITNGEADIVVGRRAVQETGVLRKAVSRTFALLFGRMLHGLSCDVQSGLKVFRRQVIREMNIHPTPWTFDLEFLVNARFAGHRIGSYDIVFAERQAGESKVKLISSIFEIGVNAVALKLRKRPPIAIPPTNSNSMIGAGIGNHTKRFITHTTLSSDVSALQTFTSGQIGMILFIIAGLAVSFYAWPLGTAIGLTALLSFIYFTDMIFNLYLVSRSIQKPPEIHVTKEELAALNEDNLPVYSVLCPLYREANVLSDFLEAMARLDWPKEKLDVMLLLEEDDGETIEAAHTLNLPEYVRVIIVPNSVPKTKPKACNYGLNLAWGEYLVIYDAEDDPDPEQLKKAYAGFLRVPKDVKCLQAKLNYHNPEDNVLTRLFTAEYSLWFDVLLTGLQSVKGYIPLGGTSNHFRTADLRSLRGWDPFNVTEDCDLGARIFTEGYKTAIIESVTFEEANSNLKNWLRQRSRWIKGYMQTYLVHMRHPLSFFRKNPRGAAMFQLVVGGKIMFLVVNPFLWLMTIAYFALYAIVGPAIESLYPTIIFYFAATSLVFGNFLYLFYYMIGCAKREHWSLIKYVFFVPFYWLMASVAASIAAYQLITKPHYWEKTKHGLHLKRAKKLADVVLEPQPSIPAPVAVRPVVAYSVAEPPPRPPVSVMPNFLMRQIPESLRSSVASRAGMLVIAMMAGNVLNFLFNAFVGRLLSFEDLAVVTVVNTLWGIAAIFMNSVTATVNHKTAYISAIENRAQGTSFLRRTIRQSVFAAALVSLLWIFAVPALTSFFRIDHTAVLFFMTPALIWGVIAAANRGFLQGQMEFGPVATAMFAEALSKFGIAAVLVYVGLAKWVYLAIPASIGVAALVSWALARPFFRNVTQASDMADEFPPGFYLASLISGIGAAIFLSLDLILVKHFLDPDIAGRYAMLSLVGKMIFFFGSLPAIFMLTFVGRAEGEGKDPRFVFRNIFGITTILVGIGVAGLGIFGAHTVPLLLGAKASAILPYLNLYAVAIGLFTIANVFVSYHLAKRQYLFPIASFAISLAMALGIWMNHSSIQNVVSVIAKTSAVGLIILAILHVLEKNLVFAGRAIRDFVEIFVPEPVFTPISGKKRILIFNWRDIRHVNAGGAEMYVQGMASAWAADGNQVTIFCGNDGYSPREEVIEDVRVIRRGGFYFVYLWAILYYFVKFRRRYDIVIDCHNGVPFFTPLYVGEPIYCVLHHVHQEVFRHHLPRPLAALAMFLEKDVMPFVYRNIKIITVSDSSRADIEELGLTRAGVEVVSPGVDLARLTVGPKSEIPLVLYLGRLKAYKSIDVLLTAFSLVLRQMPDARLVIAGSGEEKEHLERLAQQLGIAQRVYFAGRVTDGQKIQLLQKAWVMVNPSFMEGWGITTIEANACGTPVVAADVPGLRDSVRDAETGYLVPHGDTYGFASRIFAIVEDQKLRQDMAERSVNWARKFAWEKMSKDFFSIINDRRSHI